jgi:hypothetical protein
MQFAASAALDATCHCGILQSSGASSADSGIPIAQTTHFHFVHQLFQTANTPIVALPRVAVVARNLDLPAYSATADRCNHAPLMPRPVRPSELAHSTADVSGKVPPHFIFALHRSPRSKPRQFVRSPQRPRLGCRNCWYGPRWQVAQQVTNVRPFGLDDARNP